MVGGIAYNALVLAIFGIAILRLPSRCSIARFARSLLFAAVFTLVLVVAAIGAQWQPVRPELVPVAIAAIIISMLFDTRISMIAAMILAVLAGGQSVYRGTNALFLNLVGGAAAALSMRTVLRRDEGYRYVLTIGAAYLFAAVTLGLTLGWTTRQIGASAGFGMLNAFVSVVLAMFLLPLAERLTGVTTALTLVEWSDLNRPLLRRLSLEAPGTYAHTIAMANLVEAACNAIGANGLLGRVGTYYHDIGKLAKPQYFVENQARRTQSARRAQAGNERHDHPQSRAAGTRAREREPSAARPSRRSSPSITARGTSRTSRKRRAAGDGAPVPNVADYIYPGPVPQSAETAICMLADGVEASVRVLQDPTPQRVREVDRPHREAAHGSGAARRGAAHAPRSRRHQGTVRARVLEHAPRAHRLSGGERRRDLRVRGRMSLSIFVSHATCARDSRGRASRRSRAPTLAGEAHAGRDALDHLREQRDDRATQREAPRASRSRPT